ncbi:iron complex transport system substrate-binding protein [Terribacillus halophilus]|uniref:Iron complex transport system substrate-binding protein n=1 Tax=Terribacillus halophilus TaxID=361279 RepID=A0A1G6L9M9_9BACI|nr:ABC transporter substrate-binding protein [Terribacillus halophilus]SDC40029.1 iron complex transport system substrate-binding protein [Terribacillus halophilus]
MKKIMMITLLVCFCTGCATTQADQDQERAALTITDFAGREVSFSEVPDSVASVSYGDLDIASSLGATIVGRPTAEDVTQSDWKSIPEVGTVHEMNHEMLASVKSDVVLANADFNQKDEQMLESLGTEVVYTNADSVEDIKKQITLLGEMLDRTEQAEELEAKIDEKLAELNTDKYKDKKAVIVYGTPGTYMVALPNSLSGDILAKAGGYNIAADFPALEEFPQYAQLNAEEIVNADPDIVMLITHGKSEEVQQGFEREMERNAAWSSISAVKEGNVFVLPNDLFGTNPGTRITDSIDLMQDYLEGEKQD